MKKPKHPGGAPTKYGCKTIKYIRSIPEDVEQLFETILYERQLKRRILTKDELKKILL